MNVDLTRFRIHKLKVLVERLRAEHPDAPHTRPYWHDAIAEVTITMWVDCVSTGHIIAVANKEYVRLDIWDDMSKEERQRFIRTKVNQHVSHEIDECLFIDGERVSNPHPERSANKESKSNAHDAR